MQRLKDVNWNQVYCFYEVAKRLSMKEAATFLRLSQPTVSDQVKRLEDSLGVHLFRRRVRRIELTTEGQSLYEHARSMFEAGFRFLDVIASDAIGGYPVRVGLQETISLAVSIAFVGRYWDVFAPFGTVHTVREIFSDRIIERLLKNELDWAIVVEKPGNDAVEFREIGSFEIQFCCSPAIHGRFKRAADLLRSLPLVRSGWDKTLNAMVEAHLRTAGIKPSEIIESDHREFCLGLAQRGRSVATFAAETIAAASWRSTVTAFRLGEPIVLRLYAVWSKVNQRMIAVRKLKDLIDTPPGGAAVDDPELQLRFVDVPADWLVDDFEPP